MPTFKAAGQENDGSTATPALAKTTFGALAAGDTIVVGLNHTGIATASAPTAPFALRGELIAPSSSESSLHVYVGTSADWAAEAASFTFPISASRGGCILEWIVGQGAVDMAAILSLLERETALTPSIAITTTRAGALVVAFTGAKPATGTITGTAGGTPAGPPSWTERADLSVSATSAEHAQSLDQATAGTATAQPTMSIVADFAQAIIALQPPPSDTTPPTVTGRVPGVDEADVGIGTSVVATFDEALDPATVTGATFTLAPSAGGGAVPASVTLSAGDTVATLDPTDLLAHATAYTATLTTGIKDVAGNALAGAVAWEFTTAAEAVAPPPLEGVARPVERLVRTRARVRAAWRFELVGAITREPLAELHEATERVLVMVRRRPGAASFRLPLGMAGELARHLRVAEVDLLVYRDGEALWGGPVLGARPAVGEAGGSVTFDAIGIGEVLADRYTPAPYAIPAREQTALCFDLIALTQAQPGGGLGITAGALPDSVARSLEWTSPAPILGVVEELADADRGFDFAFTPAGAGYRFDCHVPRQGTDRGVVLERGRNVGQVEAPTDAGRGRLVNAAKVIGEGGFYVVAEDAGSIARYRRREAVLTASGDDAADAVKLGDMARAAIRTAAPRAIPRLTLRPDTPDASLERIRLGDRVRVILEEGWLAVDDHYLVEQLGVRLSDGPRPSETLEVIVGEEV